MTDMLALDHLETLHSDVPPDTALAALGVGCLGALFAIPPAFYPDPNSWIQRPWHLGLGLLCFALGVLRAISIRRQHGEITPAMTQRFFRIKFVTLTFSTALAATSIALGAMQWSEWGKVYITALMFYVCALILRADIVLFKHYAAQEQVNSSLRTASLSIGVFYLFMQALLHFEVLPQVTSPLVANWIIVSLGLGWVFARLAVVFALRFMLHLG